MNNLTTKQKIIVGGIISVMLIIIGIYGYSTIGKEKWEEDILIADENLQNEEVNQEKSEDNKGDIDLERQENVIAKNSIDEQESDMEKTNGNEKLEGKIVVHITGAVQKKGILVLQEGARIADAIDAAGGNTEIADLDEVNLAYVLQDGQKIYIPSKEDKAKIESKAYITSESGNNVIIQTLSTDRNGGIEKVNINTATQSELESLPEVGESIANRIIEYRKQNGKFNKIEDLQNVKGIGDAKFNTIKEHIMAQ